jgi:hypothetical protein
MEELVIGGEENLVGIPPQDDPFGLMLRQSSICTYGHLLTGEHVPYLILKFCTFAASRHC